MKIGRLDLLRVVFLTLVASTRFITTCCAGDTPIPSAMAVLGDSISEGMMTDYSLEHPPTLRQVINMVALAKRFSGLNRIEVFRKMFAKRYHSWATGNDDSDYVFSHYERLKKINPDIKAYNFAVSGAESREMNRQVDQLLAVEQTENILIDYILVLFGANDLKSETIETAVQPITFANNLETNIRRLLEVNPRRSILLVGVPNIHDIMEQSQKLIAYKILGKKLYCDSVRKSIYGNAVYFNPQDKVRFGESRMMAQMYRNELDLLAANLKEDFPLANFKAVQGLEISTAVAKSLSIDCFHPNVIGQAILAEATWIYGFWPDLINEKDYN